MDLRKSAGVTLQRAFQAACFKCSWRPNFLEVEIHRTRLGQEVADNNWQSLAVDTVRRPAGSSETGRQAELKTRICGLTCVLAEVHNAHL